MRLPNILLLAIFAFGIQTTSAQLVNTLTINTGYNNVTKNTLTLGAQDLNWTITKVATSLTGNNNYLTLPSGATLPYKAYTSKVWHVSYPPYTVTIPNKTHWLAIGPNLMDDNWAATEPDTAGHYVVFERQFKLCTEESDASDSILIDMDIRCDNFLIGVYIDNHQIVTNQGNTYFYNTPYHLNSAIHKYSLSGGTHTLKVIVRNEPAPQSQKHPNNPIGLNIVGTISTQFQNNIIIDTDNFPNYDCSTGDTTVSIAPTNSEKASLTHYPNPVNDQMTISYTLPKVEENAIIILFNQIGKVISKHPITHTGNGQLKINTSHLPQGLYIYSLYINNTPVITNKMIK
ncbi:MAG: T9SS type A sorting domain-containing protein [Flavipsychrobacter sp.]